MNTRFRTTLAALAGLGAAAATMAVQAPAAHAEPNLEIHCNSDGTICGPAGSVTPLSFSNGYDKAQFGFYFGESWRNRQITRAGLVGAERPLKAYAQNRHQWQPRPPTLTGTAHTSRNMGGRTVVKNGYFTHAGWTWRENNMSQVAQAGNLVQQWETQGKIILPQLAPGTVPPAGQDLIEVLYNPYDAEFNDPDYLVDMLMLGGLRTRTVGELSWNIPTPEVVARDNRVWYRIMAKIYTPLEVTYARVSQNCNLQPFAIVAPGTTVDLESGVTRMNCRAPNGSPMHLRWDPWAQGPAFGQAGTRQDGTGLTYRAHYTVDPYDESSAPTDGKKDNFVGRLVADDLSINTNIPIEVHITNRPRCTAPGTFTVKRGSSVFVPLSAVCTDLDQQWGEVLGFDADMGQASHGEVVFGRDANGTYGFRYTPANDYTGPEAISVRAKDQLGSFSKPVTVNFTVVHPEIECPLLSNPYHDVDHLYESWVPVDVNAGAGCKLENGAPLLGIPFSFEVFDPPHGSVSNVDQAAGTFTYLSDDPNAHPFDFVSVRVRWGSQKTTLGSFKLQANCGVRACDPSS